VPFGWITMLVGGYTMARFLHFWLTVGYCLFFVVHIAQVVRAGWNNFRAMVTGYEVVTDENTAVTAPPRQPAAKPSARPDAVTPAPRPQEEAV
jgi:hypothetical protein